MTDADGVQTLPVLHQVTLTGSDGSTGGTITYEYGVGRSLGQAVTTHGPLLDRITYPLGAISEYQYGVWSSGSRKDGEATVARPIVGVTRQTTYTEGLNPNQSIVGKPHYSWTWTRDFGSTDCVATGTDINSYEQVGPDGRRATYTVLGDPCGTTSSTALNRGPFGARRSTTLHDGDATPLRTQTLEYDYQTDTDGEIVRALGETVVTTLHDDTADGGDDCFVGAGDWEKTLTTTFRGRDAWGRWKTVIQGSDYYTQDGTSRVTHTKYLTPTDTPAGCQPSNAWETKHIIGPFISRYVEEGLGPDRRFEESFAFDCNGNLVETKANPEWQEATTDPLTGLPNDPNAAGNGTTDPRTTISYDPNGNPWMTSSLGGDGYPNGTPANTYSSTLAWELGIPKSTQVAGLAYLSTDLTPDVGGQVAAARDPNGLETRFDFDGLGRPVEVDPPGTREQKTRLVYPDLMTTRVITSPGTETTFDPTSTEQLFEERQTDNLGRVVQVWRAMPDGTRSTQLRRYDQLGRVIFLSEWMGEAQYSPAITWSSGDNNGDGVPDYVVDGIPEVSPGVPWGTTIFYGTPDGIEPGNPLKATPEGLGRVRRVVATDGSVTRRDYCGLHEEITVEGVATSEGPAEATTRNYFDAFGRLVLVDAPAGSVDAEYSYDPRGNLTKVELVDQLPAQAYQVWRDGNTPSGQMRTFQFDAAGRLERASDPESGERVVTGYDAGGNPLLWQDQMALNRGYHFRAMYDAAGRTTKVERLRGTPTSPTPFDVIRIGGAGDFEQGTHLGNGPGKWREGVIVGSAFDPGGTDWKQVSYGGCLPAAPPGGANSGALYMGNSSTCTYTATAAGRIAVRYLLSNVERDDVVSFKYWRQVRQGTAGKDRLVAFVTNADTAGDGVSDLEARYLFDLDSSQASYATWRQTPDMRPGDLFSETEWPEPSPGSPSTKNLYLYIAFEKGDTASTGSARGILIDDVFVGRRGLELIAEYSYDTDECAAGAVVDACTGEEPSSFHKGALTKATSYQSGRKVMEERLVYKGLNGRLSGRDMRIDWAGVGQLVTFADRYWYTDQGQVFARYAPYVPGVNPARFYANTYKRGYRDGLSTDTKDFLVPGATPPSLTYSAAGALQTIRFANGVSQQFALDEMHRPDWIRVTGPGGSPTLWDSSSYAFDGAGNITAIGEQSFAYDLAGRLKEARVLPQATNPSQTEPFEVQYGYDALSNMTWRQWTEPPGSPPIPPAGMEFTHSYGATAASRNQIVNSAGHRYDPNGNTTRTLAADTPAAATWSPVGVMTAFYNGQPGSGSHRVAERYAYDSRRARVLRSAEGATGDGRVIITIRDAAGTPLSEFVVDPLMGPGLDRDYLWGVGRLLVERKAELQLPELPGGGEGSQGGASAEGGVDPCQVDPEFPGCGGGGGGGGGDPDDPTWLFVDFYHHRDHLGSLRVVTDEAGAAASKHDFYPFGIEMASSWSAMPGESRMRYTVHERDAATGADYMMARYKNASGPSFLSPDPVYDVSRSAPSSWNKYGYVRSNPLVWIDENGLALMAPDCAYDPTLPWCPGGGGGGGSDTGGYDIDEWVAVYGELSVFAELLRQPGAFDFFATEHWYWDNGMAPVRHVIAGPNLPGVYAQAGGAGGGHGPTPNVSAQPTANCVIPSNLVPLSGDSFASDPIVQAVMNKAVQQAGAGEIAYYWAGGAGGYFIAGGPYTDNVTPSEGRIGIVVPPPPSGATILAHTHPNPVASFSAPDVRLMSSGAWRSLVFYVWTTGGVVRQGHGQKTPDCLNPYQ